MAGFRVPRRTALITFEGTDYDGAEIECRLDVPLGMFFDFGRGLSAADSEALFRRWGSEVLIAWNLEDDNGAPLPADEDGILMLPAAMVTMILNKWTETVAGVPAPLGGPSNGGGPSGVPTMLVGTS